MQRIIPPQYPDISIKEYRALKRKLKTLEEDNFDQIIVIPVDGKVGWYEIAEHSALIYFYEVCQNLKQKSHFFSDERSYYDQYEIGYMRTRGLEHLRKNLQKVALLKDETSLGEHIHAFRLTVKYDEEKIARFKNRELARRFENSSPLPANNLDPELYHALITASRRLHSICSSRLDRLAAETNGVRIVETVDRILKDYHRLTMLHKTSHEKKCELLTRMRSDVYELILEIKILSDAKLWNLELCASVGEQIGLIRTEIELNLKKVIKDMKGNHHENSSQS